ncbi:hypothetical protein F4818DRAFT_443785 [Hypoxylon cercidicola]|nr:hypothetical protein F4818DRAFT_443785 [Hypoxylon cercidicola]
MANHSSQYQEYLKGDEEFAKDYERFLEASREIDANNPELDWGAIGKISRETQSTFDEYDNLNKEIKNSDYVQQLQSGGPSEEAFRQLKPKLYKLKGFAERMRKAFQDYTEVINRSRQGV